VKELAVFWRHFRKGDKEMRGAIDIDQFYSLFHEKRSIFGDGIFDLCDIHHSEELDFGEYLVAVITYVLLAKGCKEEGLGIVFLSHRRS